MHRFYVEKTAIIGDTVRITGEDLFHLCRVLRKGIGDEICVCDGECGEFSAVLTKVDKQEALATLGERKVMLCEPHCKITLYQALPKAGKFELILQKCTELGVCTFVPFVSEFCVVKFENDDRKLERYRRIVYEAAKQSGRGVIPIVEDVLAFKQVCQKVRTHELALLAWEKEEVSTLKAALEKMDAPSDVAIVVGSEGGILQAEAQALISASVIPVTLGKRILRTETAGMALSAMILYHYGEMQ